MSSADPTRLCKNFRSYFTRVPHLAFQGKQASLPICHFHPFKERVLLPLKEPCGGNKTAFSWLLSRASFRSGWQKYKPFFNSQEKDEIYFSALLLVSAAHPPSNRSGLQR